MEYTGYFCCKLKAVNEHDSSTMSHCYLQTDHVNCSVMLFKHICYSIT